MTSQLDAAGGLWPSVRSVVTRGALLLWYGAQEEVQWRISAQGSVLHGDQAAETGHAAVVHEAWWRDAQHRGRGWAHGPAGGCGWWILRVSGEADRAGFENWAQGRH